jgi:hypothetical protein
MLDRLGEVRLLGDDASRLQRVAEQPSRGTDERDALAILLVARLLAHLAGTRFSTGGRVRRRRVG